MKVTQIHKEIDEKVANALKHIEQELTKGNHFYLVRTHSKFDPYCHDLSLYAISELAGFFFYYKKRTKGLLSFARKTAIEAFEKYGIKVTVRRLERMPKEYRHYYLGISLSKEHSNLQKMSS